MKFVKKLSEREKNSLYELMRTNENFKVRQRAHAILLSAKEVRIDLLSDIFEIDKDIIREWISRWETSGIDGLSDAPPPSSLCKETEMIDKTLQF